MCSDSEYVGMNMITVTGQTIESNDDTTTFETASIYFQPTDERGRLSSATMDGRRRRSSSGSTAANGAVGINNPATRYLVQSIVTEALLRAQDATYSGNSQHFFPPPPPHAHYGRPPPPPPPFWHFVGVIPFLKRLITYSVLGTVLFFLSLGMYGVFYKSVMPTLTVQETLYFDYTGIARHPSAAAATTTMTTMIDPTNSDFFQTQNSRIIKPSDVEPTITSTPSSSNESKESTSSSTSKRNRTTKKNESKKKNRDRTSDMNIVVDEESATNKGVSHTTSPPRVNDVVAKQHRQRPWLEYAPWAATDLFSRHSHWDPGFISEDFWSDNLNGEEFDGQERMRQQEHQQHHLDVIPPLKTSTRILSKNSPHFLEILLELPESEHNQRLGVFGVHVELQSSNSTTLASSIRTARFPHESRWVSVFRKIVCIFPLLIGALEESRRITIPSFRYYVESQDLPLRFVTVRLIAPSATSKGRQKSEARPVRNSVHENDDKDDNTIVWIENAPEVLRGYLQVGKELTMFQELLKEWFFSCAAVGVSFFFAAQFLLVFIVQSYWTSRMERNRRQHEEEEMRFDNASEVFGRYDDGGESLSREGVWEDMGASNQNESVRVHPVEEYESTSQQPSVHSGARNIPQEVQTEARETHNEAREYIPVDDDDDDNESFWSSMSPQLDDSEEEGEANWLSPTRD